MARKPTYEELKQRVKELEQKAIEHKRVEQKLEEIQELDGKILYGSPVAFVLHDRDLRIVRLSRAYKDVTAYNPDEVFGKSVEDFMPESPSKALVVEGLKKVRDEGVQIGPRDILAPTREEKYLSETILPIFDTTENVSYVLSVLEDITDRKQAEEKLRKEKDFTDAALNSQVDTFFLFDPSTGKAIRWNKAFRDIVGYTDEEIASLPAPASYFSPVDLERAIPFLEKVMMGGTGTIELELICKDGRRVSTEYRVAAIYDQDGKPEYLISIGRDITKRKQAEEALRQSEKKYRTLIETTDTGFVILDDKNGNVLDANSEYVRLTGHQTLDEILGKSVVEWTAPHDQKRNAQEVAMCFERGFVRNLEIDYVDKAGKTTPIEINAAIVETNNRPLILTLCRDITARKKAERALRKSGEKLNRMFSFADYMVCIADLEKGYFTRISPAFTRHLGWSEKEMLSKPILDFVHPDDVKKTADALKVQLEKGIDVIQFENRYKTKKGDFRWFEWATKPVPEEGITYAAAYDVTERKRAEEDLKEKQVELKLKAKSLEEVNTTLRVLLKEREKDKTDLEKKVLSNVKDLILPYIERIRKTSLDSNQMSCIDILKSNLEEIVSPFAQKLSSRFLGLTPTEIRVADLVKGGKTTKEIAEFMHLSPKTVEFHRDNLRKKLGIKKSKTNLRTYLLSM